MIQQRLRWQEDMFMEFQNAGLLAVEKKNLEIGIMREQKDL